MPKTDSAQLHRDRYAAMSAQKDLRTAAFDMVGGGDYEKVGFTEKSLLDMHAPLPAGGYLIDIGCGPGRLARYLKNRLDLKYLGTDVVPELLVVAREECQRPDWSFIAVDGFSIPAGNNVADVVAVFSVFTNIYPEQAHLIVGDAFRVLRPGGTFLATYFDITDERTQNIFLDFVKHQRKRIDPLVFLDRNYLEFFTTSVGFTEVRHYLPHEATMAAPEGATLLDGRVITGQMDLGQAVTIARKPLC